MVTGGGDTTHPSSSETKVKGDVWMTNIQFQLMYSQCRRSMVERGLLSYIFMLYTFCIINIAPPHLSIFSGHCSTYQTHAKQV